MPLPIPGSNATIPKIHAMRLPKKPRRTGAAPTRHHLPEDGTPVGTVEDELQAGDLQVSTANRQGRARVAQSHHTALTQAALEARRIVVVVIAQTGPLPVGGADLRQRFVERPIKISRPVREEIPRM